MRFAGERITLTDDPERSALQVDAEDLKYTPELPQPTLRQEYQRDNYILRPESGVAMLPNGEQGPSQGPNIPIKNFGGKYMPDGTQPSGYKPGPVAGLPAALIRLGVFKDLTDRPTNAGTIMTPEQEYDIYESPTKGPRNNPTFNSPRDRQLMDIMQSSFV